MFTFEDRGFVTQFTLDMERVARQLNEMSADKAAWWMAERLRWIDTYIGENGEIALLEKLNYDGFELAMCRAQLVAWETQATEMKVAA